MMTAVLGVGLLILLVVVILQATKVKDLQSFLKEEKLESKKVREQNRSLISENTVLKKGETVLQTKVKALEGVIIYIANHPLETLMVTTHLTKAGGKIETGYSRPALRLSESKENKGTYNAYKAFGKEDLSNQVKVMVGRDYPTDTEKIELSTFITHVNKYIK